MTQHIESVEVWVKRDKLVKWKYVIIKYPKNGYQKKYWIILDDFQYNYTFGKL